MSKAMAVEGRPEWLVHPSAGFRYRRDPNKHTYGFFLCPDCEEPKERHRVLPNEGTVPFERLTGRCRRHGNARGQLGRKDSRRGRVIGIAEGRTARHDEDDPRYVWVTCPDCPKPKERRVILPSNLERRRKFAGRCRDHGHESRRKLKGKQPHPSNAYFLFDKLDDIKDNNVYVWIKCPNPDKNADCKDEYIGYKANWYKADASCLCPNCITLPGRGHTSRLITDKTIPVHAWLEDGAAEAPLIAEVCYGPEEVVVKFKACGHEETWPRASARSRVFAHTHPRRPGDHFPLLCRECRGNRSKMLELLQSPVNNGGWQKSDEGFGRFLEVVRAVASRWSAVRDYPGRTFEKRLKMVGLADIGPAVGVHQNRQETDKNYRNRVGHALDGRGVTEAFPDFRQAVAEGIERGESCEEVARRLWSQRARAEKAA